MIGLNSSRGYHEIIQGIKIKTLNHGSHMLMTEFVLAKGSVLPEHSHVHEQSGYLVKGRIILHIDGEPKELKPGDSWNIPSGVIHNAEILEDSIAIEVFSPVREDYLQYVHEGDLLQQG